MVRKDIFTTLKENYNVKDAMNVISKLFESKLINTLYAGNWSSEDETIEEFVDKNELLGKWKHRQSCVNCKHMRQVLKIDKLKTSDKLDDIIFCLEYYVNIHTLFISKYKSIGRNVETSKYLSVLIENTLTLLDHINHELLEDDERFLIIPKIPEATAAAEVSTQQTGIAILQYHHALLKGDLDKKRQILETIGFEYESMLKSSLNKDTSLFNKTRWMLNELHVRHNNKDGKKADKLPGNLEEWYDELYQMLLLCILENDNIPRMKKIQKLMDSMNDKTTS